MFVVLPVYLLGILLAIRVFSVLFILSGMFIFVEGFLLIRMVMDNTYIVFTCIYEPPRQK